MSITDGAVLAVAFLVALVVGMTKKTEQIGPEIPQVKRFSLPSSPRIRRVEMRFEAPPVGAPPLPNLKILAPQDEGVFSVSSVELPRGDCSEPFDLTSREIPKQTTPIPELGCPDRDGDEDEDDEGCLRGGDNGWRRFRDEVETIRLEAQELKTQIERMSDHGTKRP